MPGSYPLKLEHGDIGSQLVSWPQEHVVKCLVFYHPLDAESVRLEQEALIDEVYRACCQSGHDLLLEVILPRDAADQNEQYYPQIVERFYQLGILPDWWKLPPLSPDRWREISQHIEHYDPECRGILILGPDAPESELKSGFAAAADMPR